MADDGRLIDGGEGPGRGDVPGPHWGAQPGSNNGGGPRTPSGLARVGRNLPDPAMANVRHGGYAWLHRGVAPMCARCEDQADCEWWGEGARCAIAAAGYQELTEGILALPHIQREAEPLVRDYATWVVTLWIASREVARRGQFVGEGLKRKEAPGVELQARASSRVQALASELGLTPAAQARLKLSAQGGAAVGLLAAIMEADQLRQAEAAEREAATMEGQFELEFGGGGGTDHHGDTECTERGGERRDRADGGDGHGRDGDGGGAV